MSTPIEKLDVIYKTYNVGENNDPSDPASTIANLPVDDFESALKFASKADYGQNCSEKPSVPERLAFEMKKKAYDEQKADENYSSSNYSNVRFDAQKLKKSASHESYKPLMSRKSPSSFTSVHVDAAVNFPFLKKSVDETKNDRNITPNAPIFLNPQRAFVIDETTPVIYDDKSSSTKIRRLTKEDCENPFNVPNYGSINNNESTLRKRGDVEMDSENVEMVEIKDLSQKAAIGRNVCQKIDAADVESLDRSKRRSTSQRSGRSQEYNLAPSPFINYKEQSGLLLSEFNPGCVTQKSRKEFEMNNYGRYSPPLTNRAQHPRQLKQNRRNKRADDDSSVFKAEMINGFRGYDSLESLVVYIEGPEATTKKSNAVEDASSTSTSSSLKKEKSNKRNKDTKKTAKKASSIGASCENEEDDDLMSGSLERSKFLFKFDDIPTKFDDEFCGVFTSTTTTIRKNIAVVDADEQAAKIESDADLAKRFALSDRDVVVDEQFIPVTSKKTKKQQQYYRQTDASASSSTKRSSTPPPRQKVNDKTIVGRRKRRNSYDSSPVNVEHSTTREREKFVENPQNNATKSTSSYNETDVVAAESQPSTSAADEGPTKLSYANIVQQRRPHSPTALSESNAGVVGSGGEYLSRSKRQTASLNASRSNSPNSTTYRTPTASATNQMNASSPDLKLCTDLPTSINVTIVSPVASSSSSSASVSACRTTYATVVTTSKTSSPNSTKNNSNNNSAEINNVPTRDETSTTNEQQQKATTSSSFCGLENRCGCDDKPPTTATTSNVVISSTASSASQRRYSCPPISNHVEFLDKPGRSADAAVPVIEGLIFGFGDLKLEPNDDDTTPIAENVGNVDKLNDDDDNNCDNNNIVNINNNNNNNRNSTTSTTTNVTASVADILKKFSKEYASPTAVVVRDPTSELVLKEVVNFVNKRWNDFIRTPDEVTRYEN